MTNQFKTWLLAETSLAPGSTTAYATAVRCIFTKGTARTTGKIIYNVPQGVDLCDLTVHDDVVQVTADLLVERLEVRRSTLGDIVVVLAKLLEASAWPWSVEITDFATEVLRQLLL